MLIWFFVSLSIILIVFMVKYILVIDINNWNIYKYMYVIYILNYLLLVNYVFFKKKNKYVDIIFI